MIAYNGYIFSFDQYWAAFTAFWWLVMRSPCVHGLGLAGHSSRCDIDYSCLHLIFISIFAYFLLSIYTDTEFIQCFPYQQVVASRLLMVLSTFYRSCPLVDYKCTQIIQSLLSDQSFFVTLARKSSRWEKHKVWVTTKKRLGSHAF